MDELHGTINPIGTLQGSIGSESTLSGTIMMPTGGGEPCKVLYNTTEYWNSHPELIAQRGYLYVYSDHMTYDSTDIAGIKAGDGTSYLIDMPFIDKPYADHIINTVIHITSSERESWNNKVRCFIDPTNEQNIVFTTD